VPLPDARYRMPDTGCQIPDEVKVKVGLDVGLRCVK